jgi:6-pyruvoyltetrahydropterin/6-carboxytetrahydropterin synthase
MTRMAELGRWFTFEAAHFLPEVPHGHKCRNLHGHSYRARITVRGPIRDDGMVMDYGDIKAIVQPLIDQLDHHCLNDTIPNPTSENLSRWLWEALEGHLPLLDAVTVCETQNTECTYRGGDK